MILPDLLPYLTPLLDFTTTLTDWLAAAGYAVGRFLSALLALLAT
ncbi:hypothetical protein [Hymenobacter sp. B81]